MADATHITLCFLLFCAFVATVVWWLALYRHHHDDY